MVASYAAVYVGVAQAAVDAAVVHLAERGLGKLPAVRHGSGGPMPRSRGTADGA